MNIMITCIGRQTMLASAFYLAIKREGKNENKLFVCDANKYASGLTIGDQYFITPQFTESNYSDWILDHCCSHGIDMLLSLNTFDLSILEKIRDQLSDIGCQLIGIPIKNLGVCIDKHKTSQFCEMLGLNHPKVWTPYEMTLNEDICWPLVAKHRFGQGSRGQLMINCQSDLKNFLNHEKFYMDYIIQNYIDGEEYGIDIINNMDGKQEGILARRKIAMRNGETDIAMTVDPEPFIKLSQKISSSLNHQGILDVDIIKRDEKYYILDLNPRFGGGYLFSHLAGADVPAAYIRWSKKENADPEWYKYALGVVCSRGTEILQVHTP